jgi:hypothetical protein
LFLSGADEKLDRLRRVIEDAGWCDTPSLSDITANRASISRTRHRICSTVELS